MNNEYYNEFLKYLKDNNITDTIEIEATERVYQAAYTAGYESVKKTCWAEQNQK